MAIPKKKITESPKKSGSKISSLIQDISKKTQISIEKVNKTKHYISTGIHILDALLSKSILHGGVPNNRITIFAGDPQTGKSYILYGIGRNAQKEGYHVLLIDTEFSVELQELQEFGLDTSEDGLTLMRTNKVEDLKIFLTQFLSNIKEQRAKGEDPGKTIILLDSIGQLASDKEIEDAKEGKMKTDMTRAKAIKSLFRIISSDLGNLEIPMVCTNHVYLCLSGENEILKSDGTYETIQNINIGDSVKTLDGNKEVLNKHEYNDSPIMKIILENGDEIKCTPNHKFLIKENWTNNENNECWKSASELKENDIILSVIEV